MERWNGRVVLVTGSSYGIGAAICKELLKHGMIVVGCDKLIARTEAWAINEKVSKGPGQLHTIQCNLENECEILAMFDEIRKKFGRVDVCINNAGFTTHSPLSTGKTDEWKSMLQVNVLALCICTRESLILMKENNIEDGQIIQIGSTVGHNIPITSQRITGPNFGIYNGTKFMVRALAEALRQELKLKSSHIRVSAISPGAVESEMLTRSLGSSMATAVFTVTVCLQPKDVANAVVFILSTPPHLCLEDIIVQPIQIPLSKAMEATEG